MQTATRTAYATDLSDEQWAILEPVIPPAKGGGRPREVNMREVINTILYLNRTGCQWDMLRHDLLPKSTVYEYFSQWRNDGTWQRLMDAVEPAGLCRLFCNCPRFVLNDVFVHTSDQLPNSLKSSR